MKLSGLFFFLRGWDNRFIIALWLIGASLVLLDGELFSIFEIDDDFFRWPLFVFIGDNLMPLVFRLDI